MKQKNAKGLQKNFVHNKPDHIIMYLQNGINRKSQCTIIKINASSIKQKMINMITIKQTQRLQYIKNKIIAKELHPNIEHIILTYHIYIINLLSFYKKILITILSNNQQILELKHRHYSKSYINPKIGNQYIQRQINQFNNYKSTSIEITLSHYQNIRLILHFMKVVNNVSDQQKKQNLKILANRFQRCIRYFLFVNTKSGNKEGLKYLSLGRKKITYIFPNGISSVIEIFDLFDYERTKLGMDTVGQLSRQNQPNNQIRVIICGGDGTIPWVINLALNSHLDFSIVTFGILPIGTGNDFSRSIGWGYKAIKFSSQRFDQLHLLVKLWDSAELGFYDVWDIQIETYEGGGFFQIKNMNEVVIKQKTISKPFTNYFGIGLDGRVVYNVEKSRGSNALFNKVKYTFVGLKNFFTKMESIDKAIQTFRINRTQDSGLIQQQSISQHSGSRHYAQSVSTSHEISFVENDHQKQIFALKEGYKGLVCLNCTSYMCGLRDVWMTQKSTDQSLKNNIRQQFNDGKLQFIAFKHQIALALERIVRTGVRIAQGQGPFQIKFNQSKADRFTYLEIDGQSVKVELIKRIRVKKSQKFPDSKLKVLINKYNEE